MGHIETLDLGRRSVPRGVVASLLHRGLEDRPSALRIQDRESVTTFF
jgi:hypothetical protein